MCEQEKGITVETLHATSTNEVYTKSILMKMRFNNALRTTFLQIKRITGVKGKNNSYRSDTIRHKHWDYRSNGVYSITICTQCRKNYFGRIDNGVMNLSKVGIIVDLYINEVPYHTKDVMVLNYIVMPNHIHMLLQKSSNNEKLADACISSTDLPEQKRNSKDVETLHATSTNEHNYRPIVVDICSGISPKSGSISTIVRYFKSAASRHSNRLG